MNTSVLNYTSKVIKDRSRFNVSYDLLSFFLITCFICVGFYPAIDNQFVHWDDQYYVTDNIYINQPTWEHLNVLLTKVISLNYHPLTMISLWLNSYFFGVESALSFIVTNIVIHNLTSYLIYKFVLSLFEKKYLLAIATAILFAIHPMHVESVVWVSERKDVLYIFFFFGSLLCWLHYLGSKKWNIFILAFMLFVLSCTSKAMAVSLVPILFLLDIYKGRPFWKLKYILEKIPFIAFAILTGLIAINVQEGGDFYGLLSNTNIDVAVNAQLAPSLYDQFSNAGYGVYFYLRSFLIPDKMSAFHPYSKLINNSVKEVFFFIPFIIVGFWIVSYWFNRMVFFGLGFFLATLVLVLQWIPVGSAIVADRYTYLSYVGLSLIVGSGLQYLYDYKSKIVSYGLLALMSFVLLPLTFHQSDIWQNHTSLFSQSVDKYPDDPKSRMLLATGLWTSGQHESAIEHIELAINEQGLHTSDAFEKLANCYDEIGEKKKAIAFYNHSIELNPNNYVARYHRGLSIMTSNPQLAIEDFNVAESSGFEYIQNNVYGPRGACYGMIGENQLAIEDFTKAINLGLDLKINYRDRAITYDKMGLNEKANQDWEIYTQLDNDYHK